MVVGCVTWRVIAFAFFHYQICRNYFQVKNMIVCMNPLHKDNIYPMDKAMELIYEEFGKGDALVQTEALEYMPGILYYTWQV